MIKKIKNLKIKVKQLLEDVPRLRDSDDKLIATIWLQEFSKDEKGLSIARQTTAFDFLEALASGKHTDAGCITRARRKIQEQNENLRGKSYKKRNKLSVEVRQQIKNI